MNRPNVLFFLADQQRYDCTGYAGKYPVSTPNIDGVGRQGAVFTSAYTPTPVCAPARQALLTGRRPESIGAIWNYNFIQTRTAMPDEWHFLRELEKAGYENTLIGAWDGSVRPAEEFCLHTRVTPVQYADYIRQKYGEIKYTGGWLGERNPLPVEDSRTHWYAKCACEQLERLAGGDKPWFMWVDGVDPHLPCRPSEPFCDMYGENDAVEWDGFGDTFENKPYIQKQQLYNWRLENMTWRDWAPAVARYYAMISQVDDAFGRIVKKLDELGLAENTLVVFASDHGDMCGSHGMIDKHYILYDDVIHVPLVMRLPSRFEGGRTVSEFVSACLDFAPTLCDLCGLEKPDGLHGKSLLPLLRGEDDAREEFTVSASGGQQFGAFTQRSIRTRDYKYIWNLTDIDELYDLNADPGELKNLIKEPQYAALTADLRKKLREELRRCQDPYAKTGWLNRQLCDSEKLV